MRPSGDRSGTLRIPLLLLSLVRIARLAAAVDTLNKTAAMPSTSAAGARGDHLAPVDRRSIPLSARLVETVREYWDLGFTAFGGPGVHVVILRRRLVPKWVDETTYTDREPLVLLRDLAP